VQHALTKWGHRKTPFCDRNYRSIRLEARATVPRASGLVQTLYSMIAFAYHVQDPVIQLVGLPKWARSQEYAVKAKPAEGFPMLSPAENREQVRLMMRAMLEDRFHLQLHIETRQERVYHLEVAKGGPKIKEVDPPVPPAKAGLDVVMGDSRGRIRGRKAAMADLASALSSFLNRRVIDRTGLAGYYDFDVRWTALETPEGPPTIGGLGAEAVGLFFANFESLTGLRVTNAVGPVEFWVVDHVDLPTAN
ncbi:MAG: TIGR03435 family protein, partial [Bryobacteraceae bacterium]